MKVSVNLSHFYLYSPYIFFFSGKSRGARDTCPPLQFFFIFMQECFPVGCVPSAAVAVWWGVSAHGGVCLGGICLGRSAWPGGVHLPPVDRILDTCFWKHYLSTTSFADDAPFWVFGKSWIHHCSSYSFYNILVQTDLTRRLQNLQGQTIAAEMW